MRREVARPAEDVQLVFGLVVRVPAVQQFAADHVQGKKWTGDRHEHNVDTIHVERTLELVCQADERVHAEMFSPERPDADIDIRSREVGFGSRSRSRSRAATSHARLPNISIAVP